MNYKNMFALLLLIYTQNNYSMLFTMPSKKNLQFRLEKNHFWFFAIQTDLINAIAGKNCTIETLLNIIDSALQIYHMNIRNPMHSAIMFMRKSHLINVILKNNKSGLREANLLLHAAVIQKRD